MDIKGRRMSKNIEDRRGQNYQPEITLSGLGTAFSDLLGDVRYGTKKHRQRKSVLERMKNAGGTLPPAKKLGRPTKGPR